jgi:hypothetical protein
VLSPTSSAPLFDPFAYETHLDPYPAYATLRARAPIYYSEQWDFWALSRFEDVQRAARDWRTFSNAHGVNLDAVGEVYGTEISSTPTLPGTTCCATSSGPRSRPRRSRRLSRSSGRERCALRKRSVMPASSTSHPTCAGRCPSRRSITSWDSQRPMWTRTGAGRRASLSAIPARGRLPHERSTPSRSCAVTWATWWTIAGVGRRRTSSAQSRRLESREGPSSRPTQWPCSCCCSSREPRPRRASWGTHS